MGSPLSETRRALTRRYVFAKLYDATTELVHSLFSPAALTQSKQPAGTSALSLAIERFKETYSTRCTSTMYIAGELRRGMGCGPISFLRPLRHRGGQISVGGKGPFSSPQLLALPSREAPKTSS